MPRALRFAIAAGLGLLMGAREISAQAPAPQTSAPKAAAPSGPRFYPDDPLAAEPTPIAVPEPRRRALSAVLETVNSAFKKTGQRQPADGVIVSRGVNTLGEVMDGDWYVNRQAARRLTLDELKRGPGNDRPPSMDAPWKVLVVKPFGVNPGLLVADSRNSLYLLRFDPRGYEGLATGAQVVATNALYALGYHVAENYVVRFDRARLVADEQGQAVSTAGKPRTLVSPDIDRFLKNVPMDDKGTYRAVALRLPEARQALLGPYQVWGTRSDDPNDIVLHEHRRDLRGLFVFAAWLNMAGFRAVSTQDVVVTVDGVARIRHFIVDLTKSLGTGLFDGEKLAFEGNEGMYPGLGAIGRNIASMGVVTPAWAKEKYPDLPEVGAFGSSAFDPEAWRPVDPLAPFLNRLPDDTFWAARQVMAFTDDEIRALVQTGAYSKPAEDWITATLIERRNRIGRTYFGKVLPLDNFRITGNTLTFDDLGVKYRFAEERIYAIDWRGFDNARDAMLDSIGTGPDVPAAVRALPDGSYVAARVAAGNLAMTVTVYLRRQADGFRVVGIERDWPGKRVVEPPTPPRADPRVYADLASPQRALFETFVTEYNAARNSQYTGEQVFERLTVSEQTTFYGHTHAAMNSHLTDTDGKPLGAALDLIESVQRIAGQYTGRGGDEQFRLYVTLKPTAKDVLDKSRYFVREEESVYHVGYPHSYRQIGKAPTMQFSLSEDGMRADVDVDYRSSKNPQAMFNGHISAANSDVRAGDNPRAHNGRWPGLITWWQDAFGKLAENLPKQVDLINVDRPVGPPTPLSPDRPSGASPDKIEDAAQEFLTDWLVRKQYDQALEFMSTRAYACLNTSDNNTKSPLDASAARRQLRTLMEYATQRLGPKTDLTSAITAFAPRNPQQVVLDQPFKREFTVGPLPETMARQYLCNQTNAPAAGLEYYGVLFTFRIDDGGTLGLLWVREDGKWKIASYQPFNQ
jgi:hypothetical protein